MLEMCSTHGLAECCLLGCEVARVVTLPPVLRSAPPPVPARPAHGLALKLIHQIKTIDTDI